jgi:uncharacterized RDD family membrane protein YckC
VTEPQPPYGQQPQYPPSGYQVPQYAQYQQPGYGLPLAPDGRPIADAGKRLLARLLDGLFAVVGFVAAGLVLVLIMAAASAIFGDNSVVLPITATIGFFILIVGFLYGYEVELPYRYNGQTPGKRIMKIAIASMEPGAPLRRGQLTYRMLLTQLFNLLASCLIGYLDPLWCLWDKPYQQCLHDKGPRTVVVRVG